MTNFSEAEFKDWLLSPVTRGLMAVLQDEIEEMKTQWAAGVFAKATDYESRRLEAHAIGRIDCAQRLLGMSYEQLIGALQDVNEK